MGMGAVMDDHEGDVFQGMKVALYVEALVALAIFFFWFKVFT